LKIGKTHVATGFVDIVKSGLHRWIFSISTDFIGREQLRLDERFTSNNHCLAALTLDIGRITRGCAKM